jgi:hypothetical protein
MNARLLSDQRTATQRRKVASLFPCWSGPKSHAGDVSLASKRAQPRCRCLVLARWHCGNDPVQPTINDYFQKAENNSTEAADNELAAL